MGCEQNRSSHIVCSENTHPTHHRRSCARMFCIRPQNSRGVGLIVKDGTTTASSHECSRLSGAQQCIKAALPREKTTKYARTQGMDPSGAIRNGSTHVEETGVQTQFTKRSLRARVDTSTARREKHNKIPAASAPDNNNNGNVNVNVNISRMMTPFIGSHPLSPLLATKLACHVGK